MEPPAVTSAGAFSVQYGLPLPAAAPLDKSAAQGAANLATPWPRRVQWATALLLFLAAVLLMVHAVIVQPAGSRPTTLQRGTVLNYRVDLNKAKRAELLQLPGIGPTLAERIEEYRNEKGGFTSIEELTKVRGIGPATLQRLRAFVCVNAREFEEGDDADTSGDKPVQRTSAYPPTGVSKAAGKKKDALLKGPIDVNRASQAELRQLPGIGPVLSQRIIDTRQQRPFAKVDDLRRVAGIGPKTLEKLRPFVTVGEQLMAAKFELSSKFQPAGDQPQAIEKMVAGFREGRPAQTLMGVTGSGKTLSAACTIAQLGKPTLVLSHNKTLAAQLYKEFRGFFPRNAVHYFISYYDYYQPEAYIPQRDIYIEKDALVNENIDRLRLAATSALVSREDVVIVASVSCIYGLGSPSDYKAMMVRVVKGEIVDRDQLLLKLVDIQYQRNDVAFERGRFRVRGDVVEVWPAYEEFALRIELFGDEVETLAIINPTSGETLRLLEDLYVYPAKHFVTPEERIRSAVEGMRAELEQRLAQFRQEGKLLEAQRLSARTRFDMEMLLEVGHCPGVENYARWFSNRKPGEPPYCLFDFFPDDFLMIVDESHATLPQLRAMFAGDHARKVTLVEHGFRLPSALDNRPLRFDEWEKRAKQVLFMSATPGPYELERCGGEIVEQVIRPTGLVDPVLHVKPARGQVPDLLEECKKRAAIKERVLVTTLTKRLAEDLSTYLREAGLRCKWLHSELDAIERVQILRELREGGFDVLVGVNLLREGLDLPEVSLVAILDADKEGFLRSGTSLIQTIGRAARNVNAEVILYADRVTDSMQRAMEETQRRRVLQLEYIKQHNITPETVKSAINMGIEDEIAARKLVQQVAGLPAEDYVTEEYLEELHGEMLAAAANLEFERAAQLRDQIAKLKGQPTAAPQVKKRRGRRR